MVPGALIGLAQQEEVSDLGRQGFEIYSTEAPKQAPFDVASAKLGNGPDLELFSQIEHGPVARKSEVHGLVKLLDSCAETSFEPAPLRLANFLFDGAVHRW